MTSWSQLTVDICSPLEILIERAAECVCKKNVSTDCTVGRVAPSVEYFELKPYVILMAQIIHILVLFH